MSPTTKKGLPKEVIEIITEDVVDDTFTWVPILLETQWFIDKYSILHGWPLNVSSIQGVPRESRR